MTCLDCKYFHHTQNIDDGYDEVLPGVLTPKQKTIPRHCEKHPELFKKLWEQNKNKLSSEVETPECFERAITPLTEMIDIMNDLLDKIKEYDTRTDYQFAKNSN